MSTKTKKKAAAKPAAKKPSRFVVKTIKAKPVPVKKDTPAKKEDTPSKPLVSSTSRFHIWDVYGVKFLMDDDMVPTRRVSVIEVTSDHDTANEPDLRNALIDDAEQQLIEQGFFMTDADAMEDALCKVEPCLDNIRHKIKYGETCQKCAAESVGTAIEWLEYLRSWRNRRYALADELGGTCNLPPVIPNDYKENWHVDGDKLVPNNPKPKVIHETKIIGAKGPEDLAKAMASVGNNLPKEVIDKLAKIVPQAIENAVKQLPAPAPEKK